MVLAVYCNVVLLLFGSISVISAISEYAVVFPAHFELRQDGVCQVILTAQTQAMTTVTITAPYLVIEEDVTLPSLGSIHRNFNCSIRLNTTESLEDKVIHLISDLPFKAQVYNMIEHSQPDIGKGDSYLALALSKDSTEYMVVTKGDGHCLGETPKSFFAIAAITDDTQVVIYETEGSDIVTANITMDAYQTFTNFTTVSGVDFTGIRIVANNPISAFSGVGCISFYTGSCGSNSYMLTSLPDYSLIGHNHVIPPIAGSPTGQGQTVRVTATEDNTVVDFLDQGNSAIIDMGDFNQRILPEKAASRIRCNKPCLVTMFSDEMGCEESVPDTGVFMMPVTPNELPATSPISFSTLDTESMNSIKQVQGTNEKSLSFVFDTYLGIVSTDVNVFLNNESLADNVWVSNDWDYYYTNLSIAYGYYTLSAGTGIEFMAYLYGHNTSAAGHGMCLQFGGEFYVEETTTTTQTTTPSTTTPPASERNPNHRIIIGGVYTTAGDEDLTTECLIGYSEVLQQEATAMISVVNEEIPELCSPYNVNGYGLTSVSTIFVQGQLQMDYLAQFPETVTPTSVEFCSLQVSAYLQEHINWGSPVLPPPQDITCPDLIFPEGSFTDGGYLWVCANNFRAILPIKYQLSLNGNYQTAGGEDLTLDCISDYSSEFSSQVLSMVGEANSLIGVTLCTSNGSSSTVNTASSSFTADGNQAFVSMDYYMDMGMDTTFGSFYDCTEDVMSYLGDHDNWRDPILPQIPGCPSLEYQGEDFNPRDRSWTC